VEFPATKGGGTGAKELLSKKDTARFQKVRVAQKINYSIQCTGPRPDTGIYVRRNLFTWFRGNVKRVLSDCAVGGGNGHDVFTLGVKRRKRG